MLRALLHLTRRAWRCDSGAAAVEFGLLFSVLAALALGIMDLGTIIYDRTDLHSAVRSGAQYFMAGGDDLETAEAIIDESWSSRSSLSEIVVERCCECAGVDAVCGQLCADGSVPDIVHELTAISYIVGVFGQYEVRVNETVRAR